MRKVFLEDLPSKNNRILWRNTKGYRVRFIYDGIEDYVEIIDVKIINNLTNLVVKYNDNIKNIIYNNFSKCKLGELLGKITSDFKIEIGTRFQDDKRDITIIDRKKILAKNGQWMKYYKYECNKCGFDSSEHWDIVNKKYENEHYLEESQILLRKTGCPCCCEFPRIVVKNINSISKTQPWMIKYLKDIDDANKNTFKSNNEVTVICPNCGTEKKDKMRISTMYRNNGIGCTCSDNISFGEKFMFMTLRQQNLNFQTQLSKSTFKWCKNFRYDFYFKLNDEEYIVETHGKQHYEDAWDKLDKTQKNDKLKKELALNNGIKEENYIVIDCRKSESEWIKQNILQSNLIELFDLNKIDWLKCIDFACSNLVKIACDYKKNNPNMTTTEIGDIMGYNNQTVCGWLKEGNKLKWCIYDSKQEQTRISSQNAKKYKAKVVTIYKDNVFLGKFESIIELSNKSEELYNVKLIPSGIAQVCRGIRKHHKGYVFKFA